MPKFRVPSYRLHKPSGRAVVTMSRGDDRYLGAHGTPESKVEYARLIAEWLATKQTTAPPGRMVPTIAGLVDAFLGWADTYYLKNGRPTGEISCLREAVRPLVRLYGHIAPAEFGPIALKTVREAWIEEDISLGVINSRVNAVRGDG